MMPQMNSCFENGGGDEREPEVVSRRRLPPRRRGVLDGAKALDRLECGLEERPSQRGEAHPAARADEQLPADLLLELVNRLGDGLNGDAPSRAATEKFPERAARQKRRAV